MYNVAAANAMPPSTIWKFGVMWVRLSVGSCYTRETTCYNLAAFRLADVSARRTRRTRRTRIPNPDATTPNESYGSINLCNVIAANTTPLPLTTYAYKRRSVYSSLAVKYTRGVSCHA